MLDVNGKPWAREGDLSKGAIVIADSGFTCIPAGTKCRVFEDRHGLYINCQGADLDAPIPGKLRRHKHYLHGQLEDGEYIGLYDLGPTNRADHGT